MIFPYVANDCLSDCKIKFCCVLYQIADGHKGRALQGGIVISPTLCIAIVISGFQYLQGTALVVVPAICVPLLLYAHAELAHIFVADCEVTVGGIFELRVNTVLATGVAIPVELVLSIAGSEEVGIK